MDAVARPGHPSSVNSSGTTTYTYDDNGNLVAVKEALVPTVTTMSYDKENRMTLYRSGSTRTTMAYDGDGLKRSVQTSGTLTTLVWDGLTILQERT
ncbi:MAG: hypothetical protein JST30_12790 [Armatimonadetes bacterium]|nr:hypothetical protein [Armatimonadota bacterium]